MQRLREGHTGNQSQVYTWSRSGHHGASFLIGDGSLLNRYMWAQAVDTAYVGNEADVEWLYNDPAREMTAVTLGEHMLVGIRRWRVQEMPVLGLFGGMAFLDVETEAYEQRSDVVDDRLMGLFSGLQSQIWDVYLENVGRRIVSKDSP